jgi:EmrB/QacA subfamily drug resistance transporter
MSANVRSINLEPVAEPGAGRWWALLAMVVSALVIGLDGTVLITALPTLSSKLGATTSDLQWIAAAYTLALGGLLLPAGVLGDRFGRKRLLLAGLLLFGLASLGASQATSPAALIGMRAVMGIGAALILPLSISILPSLFSDAERPKAVAAAAAGAFLGLPLGPLVAGYLLTHYNWGSVFLINVPVVVIALLGVWFLVPESRDRNARSFDVIGGVLAVIGVSALVYGVIEQPVRGWGDARVMGSMLAGALVLAIFVAWDLRHPEPFVELRNFRSRAFTWATMAFVMTGFALFGVMFILTPYIQIVLGNDAQQTGIRLLPLIAAVMVGAGAGNRIAAKLSARIGVTTGLLICAAGLAIFSRATPTTGYGLAAIALAVIGLGLGIGLPTSLDVVLGVLPRSQTGAGTALSRALQQIAASFGVAILGSMLNSVYQNNLGPQAAALPPAARDIAQGSIAGAVAVAAKLPALAGAPIASAAKAAYTSGMTDVMLVCAGLLVITALLIAIFLPSRIMPIDSGELE